MKLVDDLKLKLSNTCLFYDSTKRKIQVLHKYEITLVFFVLIWFSNFENQIKTKNTSVISCLWRTCIFRLVEWKNKRVFDSLSFKTSTNFRKCLNHEIANFLDVYQDFPLVGVVFSRAIHWASDKSINAKSNFGNESKNVTSSVESLSLHSALKYEKELLKIIAYIPTFGTTRWWNIFLKFFCDKLVVACYFKKNLFWSSL